MKTEKPKKTTSGYACIHCGEELGEGDAYDVAKAHLPSCQSDIARALREAFTKGE